MRLTEWLSAHPWITFLLIYVFLIYIFNKLFRVRKLPILKDLLIYLLMAVGAFILLIFQIDAELPMVLSLFVVIVLILTARIRSAMQKTKSNKKH